MNKLFDFLLSNYYLIPIIAGVLYTLLRKSPLEKPPPPRGGQPGQPGQTSRPVGRMPDFGGGGLPRPGNPLSGRGSAGTPPSSPQPPVYTSEDRPVITSRDRPLVARRSAEPAVRPEPYGSPSRSSAPLAHESDMGGEGVPSAAAKRAELEDAAYHRQTPSEAFRQSLLSASQEQNDTQAVMNASKTSARVGRDELKRAIVWAEILGPPRSRKPYRR